MGEMSREIAEACADVARVSCHIPETEPVIIFSISGQRTEGCGRPCEGCSRYSECLPETNPEEQRTWKQFLCQLIQEVKNEG